MTKKKPTKPLTPKKATKKRDWRAEFLRELAQCGNVSRSCQKAKVARTHAYAIREADPAFAKVWDECIVVANDLMEGEARRRAVEGTLRPVFQGGELVGHVQEYSDTLLIFLLKAHNPKKYRENVAVEHSGALVQTHVYLPQKGSIPPGTGVVASETLAACTVTLPGKGSPSLGR